MIEQPRISVTTQALATTFVLGVMSACGNESPPAVNELVGLEVLFGDQQIRWPGGELLDRLSVQAVDDAGNPVERAGVTVTWSVMSGGGTITGADNVTDARGRALASWILGDEIGQQSVEVRAESQRTATFTARAANPGPLLFVSDRVAGVDRLFLMHEDGSDVMPLTSASSDLRHPAWSPDGMRIAASVGSADIVVMDWDGSNYQEITNEAADVVESPAWSPDGSRITYSVKKTGTADCVLSDYNIYAVDPNGGGKAKLTEGCGGRNTGASWSPDGSKIVFESRRDAPQDINTNLRDIEIYVMNSDGSDETRLTYNGSQNDVSPTWTANGEEIFFVQSRPLGEGGTSSLWRMNSDGTSQTLVREFNEGVIFSIALNPDGSSVLLDLWDGESTDMFVLDLDTLELRQITDRNGSDHGGTWRPPTN